jgi:CheY-like chemotaxis protein
LRTQQIELSIVNSKTEREPREKINRVLVLGQGSTASTIAGFVLQADGVQVTLAESLESAETRLNLAGIDLIVLDWQLEGASNALRPIRQSLPSVPVILIASTPLLEKVRKSATAVIRHSETAGALVFLVRLALHPPADRHPELTAV